MSTPKTSGRLTVGALAVVIGALLGGCGGTSGTPTAPALTAADWVEQFCVAVVAAKPPADATLGTTGATDPKAVSTALTKQIEALDSSIGKLEKVGPSPVKSGDEGLKRTKDAFTKARTAFSTARDKIAGLAPNDAAGLASALTTASQEVAASTKDLGTGLDDSELQAAAASAPTCKANGIG